MDKVQILDEKLNKMVKEHSITTGQIVTAIHLVRHPTSGELVDVKIESREADPGEAQPAFLVMLQELEIN